MRKKEEMSSMFVLKLLGLGGRPIAAMFGGAAEVAFEGRKTALAGPGDRGKRRQMRQSSHAGDYPFYL